MSYWYTFSNGFQIDPPVVDLPSDFQNYIKDNTYWMISEDGGILEQKKDVGGNNSCFEEELGNILERLHGCGYHVKGVSFYAGEEALHGEVGWVEIDTEVDTDCSVVNMGPVYELLRKLEDMQVASADVRR